MKGKMKAYVMKHVGEPAWVEKDIPQIGPNDALLRPIVVAPCTTDVHALFDGAVGDKPNQTLGHEAVAEVVEVGECVKDFKPGDRVMVPAVTPNWSSVEAQGGYSSHSDGLLKGWRYSNYMDGLFSEYFTCNDADGNLALLPDGVRPEDAVMLSDMLPPAVMAVNYADIQFGDVVLVVGTGAVGLLAIATAYLKGASRVIAVGSRSAGRKAALEYGATDVVNYKEGPFSEKVMSLTEGRGVDSACICGGGADAYAETIRSVHAGGAIGSAVALSQDDIISIPAKDWALGMSNMSLKGGSMIGGRRVMEKLASLLQTGRLDVSKVITHTFHGWDELETALYACRDKKDDYIKSVVILDK